MRPQFRHAYLRGEEDAYRKLGGDVLVTYMQRCAFLRMEPEPSEIERLVVDHNKPPSPEPGRVYADLNEFAIAHPPKGWTIDPKTLVATQNG